MINFCLNAVVGSRHMVSYSRKVSIKGSNSPKNCLLGYFRVPCLWSAYGSQETLCDAYTLSIPWWTFHRWPFPGWLLLRDVRFPAIHVRKSSFGTVSAMAKLAYHFFKHDSPGGATIGSPICTGTLLQCTFSSFICIMAIVNCIWVFAAFRLPVCPIVPV